MHSKFLTQLAVFSWFVCTAPQLVYHAHQLEEIQLSTPVTIRCAPTTIHQVAVAHFIMQVCIDDSKKVTNAYFIMYACTLRNKVFETHQIWCVFTVPPGTPDMVFMVHVHGTPDMVFMAHLEKCVYHTT